MQHKTRSSSRSYGFTIIELLVVIGIIVVLLSILLPVVNAIRKTAQKTATTNQMGKLSIAIHAYYNDFGGFPGPIADTNIYGYNGSVTSITAPAITNLTQVSSTQNLTLGLLGGLAVTGTQTATVYTYPNTTAAPIGPGGLIGSGPQSLNPLKPAQSTTYFDTTPSDLANNGAGVYVSWTTANAPGTGATLSAVPEIMDQFSTQHPIIYLRASAGGTTLCDTAGTSQYYTMEMAPYWIGGTNTVPTTKKPGVPFPTQPDANNGNAVLYSTAASFFANPAYSYESPLVTPKSKDTFILISAGYDGVYGTSDDIVVAN